MWRRSSGFVLFCLGNSHYFYPRCVLDFFVIVFMSVNTKKKLRSKAEMTPPSLLISKISSGTVGCRFLNRKRCSFSIDFWIGNSKVFYCWFLNQKRNNFWLSISELAATHLLATDLWIDSGAVLAVDFWIGSDTVKLNKELVLDRPTLRENGNRNQPKDNSKGR